MTQNSNDKIEKMIKSDDVVLFMKGTPEFPQCGFSANVIGILNYLGVKFSSYNVLDDDNLRQSIKDYANWPTIPQVYIKNEFVGGCDILREIVENGEFEEMLKKHKINYKIDHN
jgi:monothiol glutaredoxin